MTDIRLCRFDEAQEIYDLMVEIYDSLENKTLYFLDNLEFVKQHIADEGFVVGGFHEHKLISYFIVRIPGNQKDNLGYDIGIDNLDQVAHMESLGVKASYRGNGIQKLMVEYAENILMSKGFKFFMCTVSPQNTHSVNNFTQLGYIDVKKLVKYNDVERIIMLKKV